LREDTVAPRRLPAYAWARSKRALYEMPLGTRRSCLQPLSSRAIVHVPSMKSFQLSAPPLPIIRYCSLACVVVAAGLLLFGRLGIYAVLSSICIIVQAAVLSWPKKYIVNYDDDVLSIRLSSGSVFVFKWSTLKVEQDDQVSLILKDGNTGNILRLDRTVVAEIKKRTMYKLFVSGPM